MLYLIIILGFLLRITNIQKPEGLWNDEYVSWFVASTPFNSGFWNEILKQCHMPFYYLYLKPFVGFDDVILRLTSVIPGVLVIPVMYYIGKLYSKKVAYFSAVITSVLPFLIYYSQEVRFYSVLFLFSALSLLFTLRYIKDSSKVNLVGYIISNLLVLFTHVLGGIYLFFNLLYLFYKKKKMSKIIVYSLLVSIPFVVVFGINILKMLPSSQWWGHFSYTNILFLFSDFFSPILTNNVNAPNIFFYNKNFAFWMLVPTIIALIGVFKGIKKTIVLNIICLGTIIVMSLLAKFNIVVFITKYLIEILPILILTISIGFDEAKKIGTICFGTFIFIQLVSLLFPFYVTKLQLLEGHRTVAEVLKAHNAESIVFTYYEPNRFERYINLNGKKTYHISKSNRFEYIDEPQKILSEIKINDTVSVVFLDSVSFFDDATINANKDNPNIPEMFLTFSQVKNKLIDELNNNYADYKFNKIGSWSVISAKRIK